jgi:ketosteroid isomerase-like protein
MKSSKTDIVKQFLETAIACDWEKLAGYCHEQFSVRESDALPYAGVHQGIDGFRKLARLIFIDSFKDFKVEPQYYAEGDNHVLLFAVISGVGKETGIPFSTEVAEIYLFEDDLIKEIQPFYWDTKLINDVLATDA